MTLQREGNNIAVKYLNELEFVPYEIDGRRNTLLANVWYQDVLLSIDTLTGKIPKVYNFAALNNEQKHDVFNGVSVTDEKHIFYVTGKNWSKFFKIELY